jgi:lambda family phage portal protein
MEWPTRKWQPRARAAEPKTTALELLSEGPEPVSVEPTQLPSYLPSAAVDYGNHSLGYGYNGEKYTGGWGKDEVAFVDGLLALDYYSLRLRSHQLFETNMYARGLIRRLVTNEVNTGLSLESRPISLMLPGTTQEQLHEWSDRVEAFWKAYIDEPDVCDYEQRAGMTFGALTAQARLESLVGGDCLIVTRIDKRTRLPTIQLIPGHQIVQPLKPNPLEGNAIFEGVEVDKRGRHVAYHVIKNPYRYGFEYETQRIKAHAPDGTRQAWLMYGTDRRIGQQRGVPLLGLVLQSLREIDRYRDSTQRKAVINSIVAMWVEKSEDKMASLTMRNAAERTQDVTNTNYDGTSRSYKGIDLVPGMVLEELQHGEQVHAHKNDGGDNVQFPDFEAAIMGAIMWACEIPPEIGRLSFNANYSASQAALNEFKIYLEIARTKIAENFNRPIYRDWLLACVRRGVIQAPGFDAATRDITMFETVHAWTNAAWIGAVKPVTDILKMVKAFEIMVARGWTTNARVAQELTGTKFQTNARELAREREELPAIEETDNTQGSEANVLLDGTPEL